MLNDEYIQMIQKIETLSIPYYLQNKLEERYIPNPKLNPKECKKNEIQIKSIEENYENKIKSFAAFTNKNQKFINQIVKPVNITSNFNEIAYTAATHFRQGYEMFSTVLNLPENVSPLVEYYAILQCVKGAILLDLEINREYFFSKHGLSPFLHKDESRRQRFNRYYYIRANIWNKGVFPALLIRSQGYLGSFDGTPLVQYLNGNYKPTLKYIVSFRNTDSPNMFIGSRMLSSLVRYKPEIWKKICSGEEDDLIRRIRIFRREGIPNGLRRLLHTYIDWYRVEQI